MPQLARTARPLLALAGLLACLGAGAADRDRDGLDDALEDALLARYAPLVLLHPSEPAMPASTDWLLARAELEPAPGPRPRILAASVLGLLSWPKPVEDPAARLHPRAVDHAGSRHPGDWVVYGHAFPAEGGGVVLQYWFFYPFNDGYGVFDHEGDWEHVSVKLSPALAPEGAWYARHYDSHPGRWFDWSALAREGDHPVVLSARGTHASYASPAEVPPWERTCETTWPAAAAAGGCTPWRTWAEGTGGIVNVGERSEPRVPFIAWPGRWGSTGRLGGDSHEAAPRGPAFQVGWCIGGAPGACDEGPPASPAPLSPG
jgi:hypothetical protein